MKRTFTYKLNIFLFLLPALILFVGILIAPIIMSTYYSFHEFNLVANTDMEYVGLENYKILFSSMLTNPNTGKLYANSMYLSIFFMPVLISTVIIGRLWMNIYDPGQAGLLNAGLRALGIDKWLFPAITNGITSSKLPFTGQWTGFRETALIASFIPILWQYVGYHMLLMYAGIKGVPTDLLEAAQLDGCTEGQVNRYIIIPYIKPILKVCVIFAVTGSLKSFDLIYALMKDTSRAELPSTLMYKLLFLHNRYGLGSTVAVVLIVLCFLFAILISFAFRDRGAKVS
jgi:raffinose/stachyose/melibiose transport system permease protein